MSTEENKAVIRRVIEEVWNKGNLAVADEVIANNYVFDAAGQEFKGPEGLKQAVTIYRTAFPDFHITIDDMVAEGDKVASRFTGSDGQAGYSDRNCIQPLSRRQGSGSAGQHGSAGHVATDGCCPSYGPGLRVIPLAQSYHGRRYAVALEAASIQMQPPIHHPWLSAASSQ